MKPISGLLALGLMAGLSAQPASAQSPAPRSFMNSLHGPSSSPGTGGRSSAALAERLRAAASAQGKSL